MIILWIKKRKPDKQPSKSDKESFREHDEMMKQFRHTHPELNVINSKDIMTADGNLLAPVQKVILNENTHN